jgi:hypothetical protein
MPTTAKGSEAKESMFAGVYVLGRLSGGVDLWRPEQRITR